MDSIVVASKLSQVCAAWRRAALNSSNLVQHPQITSLSIASDIPLLSISEILPSLPMLRIYGSAQVSQLYEWDENTATIPIFSRLQTLIIKGSRWGLDAEAAQLLIERRCLAIGRPKRVNCPGRKDLAPLKQTTLVMEEEARLGTWKDCELLTLAETSSVERKFDPKTEEELVYYRYTWASSLDRASDS